MKIKTLIFIVFNIIALCTNAQIKEIITQAPISAEQGKKFAVEYSIIKERSSFFTKMEIRTPTGCSMSSHENAGAEISSIDNKMVLTWLRIPNDSIVKVILEVTTDSTVGNRLIFAGHISSLHLNQRIEVGLPEVKVLINRPDEKNDKAITDSTKLISKLKPTDELTNNTKKIEATDSLKTIIVKQDTTSSQTENKTNDTIKTETCTRTIKINTEHTWIIDIQIETPQKLSAGKIQERIPEGYYAHANNIADAEYSNPAQKIEFIWKTIPEKNVHNVSYKLIPKDKQNTAKPQIDGDFTYFKNNKKLTIPTKEIFIKNDSVKTDTTTAPTQTKPIKEFENQNYASIIDINETIKENKTTEQLIKKEETKKVIKQKENKNVTKTNTNKKHSETKKINKTLTYRIEIYSAKEPVSPDFFKKYKYEGIVMAELANKMYKYTIGDFKSEKEAQEYKEQLLQTTLFPQASIITYENGIRAKKQ